MATATNSINSIDMYFERFVKIRIDLIEPEIQSTESITFSRCSTFIVTWILWETKMKTMLYFAYFHIILSSTFENLSILFVFVLTIFLDPCWFFIQSMDIIAFRYIANRSVKHTWPIHIVHSAQRHCKYNSNDKLSRIHCKSIRFNGFVCLFQILF